MNNSSDRMDWDTMSTWTEGDVSKPKKTRKQEVLAKKSPSEQNENKLIKKQCNKLRKNIQDILPEIFKKGKDHVEFFFNIISDFIRMNYNSDNNVIEFLITEQRFKLALVNFLNLKRNSDNTITRPLVPYIKPYQEMFEEISRIGEGGFGKVYKVKHRLDEGYYALKKIPMKARHEKEIVKSLEEVKTLAKLNHPNIVTYNQAWIELSTNENKEFNIASSSSSYTRSESTKSKSKKRKTCSRMEIDSSAESSRNTSEPLVILHIQMSLCEQNLREWMDKRTEKSPIAHIEDISKQILRGLDHIHKQNIIHHDIKPENIFISNIAEEFQVKIGDFGLACPSQKMAHSENFGTPGYVAPEQKKNVCDPKSDIYSFGIVLYELLYIMKSKMERYMMIENKLKKGVVPNCLEYPEWKQIIEKTVRENPAMRPTAEVILEILRSDEDIKMEKLKIENDKLRDDNNVLIRQRRVNEERILILESQLHQYKNYFPYIEAVNRALES